MNFYLVQRGKFRKDGGCLTGTNGVVDLDYMGSSEFEFGAIPRSFRRLLHDFDNYIYVNTNIFTKDNDELILFVDEKIADEMTEAIKSFINKPHPLKEYSELEKIPNSSISDAWQDKMRTNFWWFLGTDTMAFLNSYRHLFEKGINNDYNNWWMKKDEETREKEYTMSLRLH